MRVSFLFLFVLFFTSAIAEVVCVKQNDGSWICSGSGGDSNPYPGIVVTNGIGVCTNCLQMTVSECETLKVRLKYRVKDIRDEFSSLAGPVFALRSEIGAFTTKWNEMQIHSYTVANTPPEYAGGVSWAQDQIQAPYFVAAIPGTTSTIYNGIYGIGASNNSIANFYLQEVQPLVNKIDSEIATAESRFRQMDATFSSYASFVDDISCEECKLDPDSSDPGGGGSGGDSGGGGSGGDCCGPCVEQLQALNEVALTIESRVRAIEYSVDSVSTNLSALSKSLEGYLITLTNSVGRIDSFVTSDLANSMRQLTNSLVVIERNVDGIQRDFYQAMSNAQHFVSMGDKKWDPVEISTNFFEVGEYKDLPWASRVEALLLHLSQPFGDSSQGDPDADEKVSKVQSAVDSLNPAGPVSSFSQSSETVFNSLRRSVGSIQNMFSGVYNVGHVRVLESDQWIGDHELVVNFPDEVVEPVRAVMRLVWAVSALVMLFFIWVFVVRTVLPMFNLVRKFVTHLVKA